MRAALALALALLVSPAVAQDGWGKSQKPLFSGPALTGNPVKDIENAVSQAAPASASILSKPFQDLANFLNSDAAQAIALSTQIPALQDGNGQQCWMQMANAGAVFKAHPVPLTFQAMTDIEALRLLAMTANNLCANVHCTQVFSDLTSMAQAASPTALPIPSLHDLCSKIPQIPVVAPVSTAASSTVSASTSSTTTTTTPAQ